MNLRHSLHSASVTLFNGNVFTDLGLRRGCSGSGVGQREGAESVSPSLFIWSLPWLFTAVLALSGAPALLGPFAGSRSRASLRRASWLGGSGLLWNRVLWPRHLTAPRAVLFLGGPPPGEQVPRALRRVMSSWFRRRLLALSHLAGVVLATVISDFVRVYLPAQPRCCLSRKLCSGIAQLGLRSAEVSFRGPTCSDLSRLLT